MNTVTFLTPVQAQLQLVEARLHAQADDHHPDLHAAFEQILAAGGKRIRPSLSLLVGDMLGADVLGAHNAGLRGIWATMQADRAANEAHADTIVPEVAISSLAELPELLKKHPVPHSSTAEADSQLTQYRNTVLY